MSALKKAGVRTLAAFGMAGVIAAVGAVSYNASAAESTGLGGRPGGGVPPIAEAIKPPAGSKMLGTFKVTKGVQTYTCVVATGATSGAFTGTSVPEAQLSGSNGKIHHFAGPSWQMVKDKSLVTAARDGAGIDRPGSIPELRLKVNSHTGKGLLTRADYINRLATSGGAAPAGSCTAGQTKSVPYGAVYVFWDAPAA